MITADVKVTWEGGAVSGAWQRPDGDAWASLVLGHGAAYDMNSRLMIDIGAGLASGGVAVLRFNFPYAEDGRGSPDPQPRLEACFRAVAVVQPVSWTGNASGPRSTIDRFHSTAAGATVRPGKRARRAEIASCVSALASCAPRQKCAPCENDRY